MRRIFRKTYLVLIFKVGIRFLFAIPFSEETQVTLLRNAWVEIFALGLAQCSQTLSIPTIISSLVNYVKTVISQDKVPPSGVKKIVEHVWKLQEFVSEMNRLDLDDCEYAYLKLISLFNPGWFETRPF